MNAPLPGLGGCSERARGGPRLAFSGGARGARGHAPNRRSEPRERARGVGRGVRRVARRVRSAWRSLRARFHPKLFGIGQNKTGTTTLAAAWRRLGFHVSPQKPAERLLRDWAERRFERLIAFCRDYEAFQDIPFSLRDTYRALDEAYPGSKFILTVRDTGEQWFESMLRFQSQMFGGGGRPTWSQLQAAEYCYPGYMADTHRLIFGADAQTLFDRPRYLAVYEAHNAAIREYFADRSRDFLELNVGEPQAYERMCTFLSLRPHPEGFLWKNRSR